MEHSLLQRFNGDVNTKEAVLAYFKDHFESRILELAYKGEDVSAVARAVVELEGAFEKLSIEFGIREKQHETKNQAR